MAAWTLVLTHMCFKKYSNKLCDAKNFIPTLIYTWHLVADGTHQTSTRSAFTFKYLSHHGPRLLSQYIRSWFEIFVARRLQLASHQCLLQITCQPGVSQGVQIDGSHWATSQICDCVQCWEVMDHPPCSRDLAHSVIPLFVPLNLLPRSLDIFKF